VQFRSLGWHLFRQERLHACPVCWENILLALQRGAAPGRWLLKVSQAHAGGRQCAQDTELQPSAVTGAKLRWQAFN